MGLMVGGVVGAGALYVTKVDPSLIAGLKPQPAPEVVEEPVAPVDPVVPVVVEEPVIPPIVHQGLPQTPFEMGSLPPDEAVESIKITLGVGTEGAALSEPVDVHLGLGFPLRLYPLGRLERDPSFAAFPHKSSLEGMLTAIQPGQMASFEFSAKKGDVGVDELRTAQQLLADLKCGDLQSIGFASQGRSDWVLAGYRIEVNGKLFAANGLVNARVQEKLASSRKSLMKLLPSYESKRDKDKLTVEEEAELKTEHMLVRALSGRVSGAAPWYEESDEKFQAAPITGTQVEHLTVTLTSGNGTRPGTRNPLYLQAGARKYLLSSEEDPLADETQPQIFNLAGFELALNPLTKESLSRPGVGVIGSGGPMNKVPDRAQLGRVLVEADGKTVYDSDKQADDKKALPSFWLTPLAHYDEAGGLVKTPPEQGEVPLWTAGMKGVIPAAGIVPEPPPNLVVGPKKTLPPLLPPNRRTLGGGLPVRSKPGGLLGFLNALANLLKPIAAAKAPTISGLRIAPATPMVCDGDRVAVTWNVSGNASQITSWRVDLFGVLPHLPALGAVNGVPPAPGTSVLVFTPLATDANVFVTPLGGTFRHQMTTPISTARTGLGPAQVPSQVPYLYVMPVVTGFNSRGAAVATLTTLNNGNQTIVTAATGSILPLFPQNARALNVGFLARGAASPPTAGDSPAPSFQVTTFSPSATGPWTSMLSYRDPGTTSTAWGLNIPTASHVGLNFDSHEGGFFAPNSLSVIAALNTATRPQFAPSTPASGGVPSFGPEMVRLRYEGFVAVPATSTQTLRVVAHVGFTGGSDPGALCNIFTARAELSARKLTPDSNYSATNVQNLGPPHPYFTIETASGLPQIGRSNPMALIDIPLRLNQLSINPVAYAPGPAYIVETNYQDTTQNLVDPDKTAARAVSPNDRYLPNELVPVTSNPTSSDVANSAASLAAQMRTRRVYVTVNLYLDLQTTDPKTAVGVFGMRIVPE